MKKAKLLHNPGAGDGDTTRKELIRDIESAGFKCSYSSTKQFRWENLETDDVDFLILAGGDGTVRKIAEELLTRKAIEKNLPIGLLPMGTANNIAKTLKIVGDPPKIMKSWHDDRRRKFDVGVIKGLEDSAFFLESFGYGLFPRLMQQMKKRKKNSIEDPQERLQAALEILLELIEEADGNETILEIDGKDYSGQYLLVEVMNIRSIGPNLHLAPEANPDDGLFDVVLIKPSQRGTLAEYVRRKVKGQEVIFDFPVLRGKALSVVWEGKHFHVDDEHYKAEKPVKVKIEVREGLLEFLLPPSTNIN